MIIFLFKNCARIQQFHISIESFKRLMIWRFSSRVEVSTGYTEVKKLQLCEKFQPGLKFQLGIPNIPIYEFQLGIPLISKNSSRTEM